MVGWKRRSVLAAGGAIVAGGAFASTGASQANGQFSVPPLDDSAGWSSYNGNPGNTAYVPADESFPEPNAVAWQYDEEGDVAVLEETVYLRTEEQVHALEAEEGELLWEAEDIDAAGTPAVSSETVVVGGEQVTALEASSGSVLWEETFDEDVPSPTVAFETVFVAVDETLYALDLDDGSVVWERSTVEIETTDGDEELSFQSTPIAVANELVYAEVGDAGYVALEATTGETEWTYWWEYSTDPHGYLVATGERLYTGEESDGEEFPVLDAQTGERVEYASYRFPLAVTDDVRVRTNRHGFRTSWYETDDSWSVDGATDEWGRPVVVGDTVIVPSHSMADDPSMYAFDLEDGSQRWAVRLTDLDMNTLDGSTWPSDSFVATEDTIYVTGPSQVVAIRSVPDEEATDDERDDQEEPDQEQTEDEQSDEADGDGDDADADGDGDDEEADDEREDDADDELGSDSDDSESEDDLEEVDGADDDVPDNASEAGESGDDPGSGEDAESGEDAGGDGDDTSANESADGEGVSELEEPSNESADSGNESTTGENESANGAENDSVESGNVSVDDSDDGVGNDSETDSGNESTNGSAEEAAEDNGDSVPGFTTVAGLASGGVALEWLRRSASRQSAGSRESENTFESEAADEAVDSDDSSER